MATILNTIAQHTAERYEKIISQTPLSEVKVRALAMTKGGFEFEKALAADGISFICEVKKASPSKGVIAEDFPYLEIAREYEAAGAAAISCLTEPKWFMGSDEYSQVRFQFPFCERISPFATIRYMRQKRSARRQSF